MLVYLRNILCLLLLTALAACGGGGGSTLTDSKTVNNAIISGSNVAPLIVDSGPAGLYTVNEVFTSVTICDTATANNCQTIDHILVDTGSSGLRIMSSVISPSLNLPQQTDASGKAIGECGMFVDGYTWGPVKLATMKIADQTALSIPIQVIGDTNFALAPTPCANTGTPENTVDTFGANGVLGVGYFQQDCGTYCEKNASANIYYSCSNNVCTSISLSVAQQLPNPVNQFASDNNGVMLSLPALNASGNSNVAGSLVFGINTQTNNDLGSAQIYTVDPNFGYITTSFEGQTLSNSFIDSGSNGLYFASSTLTSCSAYPYFYCPPSTQNFTATIQGGNANQISINFSVANATSLFATGNTAFDNLAGTGITNSFDWGLPFFYGRKVYVVIEGQLVGGSVGPFIAF